MSMPRSVEVSCPKCGKKYETTIFDSLNTEFAPNTAESVVSGERFEAKCPLCGFVAHLEYDMLYHDMKHGAMIWVTHTEEKEKIDQIKSTDLIPYKNTRIVKDMNRLREKAACLEAQKDDRVIELCKVLLERKLIQQRPDFRLKDSFYGYANGEHVIFFYDEKGEELRCALEENTYLSIFNVFEEVKQKMDQEPFQIIDRNWAIDFLDHVLGDDI